jgi:hypothetical protein
MKTDFEKITSLMEEIANLKKEKNNVTIFLRELDYIDDEIQDIFRGDTGHLYMFR